MKTLRKILGYTWAALALPVLLATFFGLDGWARLLAHSTGVQISPWITGGEIVRTWPHEGYETRLHRPVFDGLISPRAQGFVQVDWIATPPATNLPAHLEEQIDYDNDGHADFAVELDGKSDQATLKPLQSNVVGSDRLMHLKNGRVLRIILKRTP